MQSARPPDLVVATIIMHCSTATTVIYRQIDYIQNYDVGFRPDNIVAISTPEDSMQFSRVRAFKDELTTHQHLVERASIVNDALVKALGWTDPLSQTVKWGGDRRVIGVVGDIHYKSLYNPVQPQIFVPHNYRIVNVLVALKPEAYRSMNELKAVWVKYFPNEPFVYRYLDHTLQEQYKQEATVVMIASYFSVLTILISLLGILGLSLLDAYQRKKEIGVRKVVGAGFRDIVRLFFVQYLGVLIIASIVTSPIAWYLIDQWHTKFNHHAPLDITIFIFVGIAFSLITLLTVAIGIRRVTAISNVDLLR